jgi:hypothetical protein
VRSTLELVGTPALELQGPALALLSAVLRSLPGLSTPRVRDSVLRLWRGAWDLLASSKPNVPRLELHTAAWATNPHMLGPPPPFLRELEYGHTAARAPEYQASLPAETRTLNTFLLVHGARLCALALPAELALFAFLRGQAWPALASLTLHGYPPVGDAGGDLAGFLAAAPALRDVRIDVARTATTRRFVVLSPGRG